MIDECPSDQKIDPLPKTLQLYVDRMGKENRPMTFSEIVVATPGINSFRHLILRGLVKNIIPPYATGEEYNGSRIPYYVLTKKGKDHL